MAIRWWEWLIGIRTDRQRMRTRDDLALALIREGKAERQQLEKENEELRRRLSAAHLIIAEGAKRRRERNAARSGRKRRRKAK